MRMLGFLFFLLFLAGFALILLQGGAGTTGDSSDRLAGSRWSVRAIAGERVAASEPLVLEFGERGRIGGDTGCGLFSAAYTLDEGRFALGGLRSTRESCSRDARERARALFAALQAATRLDRDGDALRLIDGEDEVAVGLARIR